MIIIDPTKEKTLTFKVDITGSTDKPFSRIIFLLKDDSSIMFNAIAEEGVVKAKIPPLVLYRDNLVGTAKLELIIGEYYFLPWQGQFELKEETKVEVQLETPDNSKPIISISDEVLEEAKKHKENIIEENIDKPITEKVKKIRIKKEKTKLEEKLTKTFPIRKIF